ncbi:MAG: hypothetical protein M3O36_16210, partial [Myxococcota bacterium]|nr:hypothetical protein [Myxococcota bacterium]
MHYFAYAVPDEHGEIGVAPVPLGEVFDTFEYEGADPNDLPRLVEERNGPLRVEVFSLGRWTPYPQRFDVTTQGYREARFLVATLREQETGP